MHPHSSGDLCDPLPSLRQGDDPSQSEQPSQRDRPTIERRFADQKKYHGLGRVRYWGLAKVTIQALLTCIVVNCKKIVRLLSAGLCRSPGKLCPAAG